MKNTDLTGMRRPMNHFSILSSLFLCILIMGTLSSAADSSSSDSSSDEVDPFMYNTWAASHVQISNITIDPIVLMPEDLATVTLVMENTDKTTPVAISEAGITSKDLKVLTRMYDRVGAIGPTNRLPLTFTLQAGMKQGIYYPVFSASFRGAHFMRFPFPVVVQDNPVVLSIFNTPDTWIDGKKGMVTLNLANLRTNPVTSVIVSPEPGAHEIMPASFVVGVLNSDYPVQIPFNITPHGSEPINFTVRYQNGINKHTSTCSLPISTGTSRKQANLSISRIEVNPDAGHLIVKGDVYNSGLEIANAVGVTVKDPAEAVYPYKQYAVGLLKPSDFASFQLTFKPSQNATSETLVTNFKDSDGRVVSTETSIDISDAALLMNLPLAGNEVPNGEAGGFIPTGMELPIAGLVIVIIIAGIAFILRRKKSGAIGTYPGRNRERKTGEQGDPGEMTDNKREDSFRTAMDIYQKGDFTQAAELFHQIVQEDKTNHKAWNAYGICLTKHNEYDAAAGCFENAIRLDQGNYRYQKNYEINDKRRNLER